MQVFRFLPHLLLDASRYVRSPSPPWRVTQGCPSEFVKNALTISEPAKQVVRPAYAQLDEGCSE
jgi:hypothetical protein